MALGNLIVRIGADVSDLNRALTKTDRDLQRLGRKMQRTGRQMTVGITAPLAGIAAASIKMASDAEESANKFDVVMGGSAASVRAELQALTRVIPETQHELEGMAAGVQDMLVPFGVAREEAAGMSLNMVKLAGDISSFNNVRPSEALEAMRSALAGSSEPMLRFGVDTRVATLQTIALREGLIQQGEALDNTTRAQAVLIAIQEQSTDAMGDAERTVGSAANQFKFLAANTKELGVSIGTILIPVITPMVQKMSEGLKVFQGLSPATQKVVVGVGALAAAAGPLLLAFGTILKLLPVIQVGFAALTGPVGLAVVAFGAVVAAAVQVIEHWDMISFETGRMMDAIEYHTIGRFTRIVDQIGTMTGNVAGFFSSLYDRVVGNSYVPDMIDGIAMQFARLDQVMVIPAVEAAAKVSAAFKGVQGPTVPGAPPSPSPGGGSFLGGILGGVGRNIESQFDPEKLITGMLTGGISNLIGGGISGLMGGITGLFRRGRKKENDAMRGLDRFGKSLDQTSSALLNVPQDLRLVRRRLDAIFENRVAGLREPGGGTGGPNDNTDPLGGGGNGGGGGGGGGGTNPPPPNGSVVISGPVTIQANDPEEFFRQLQRVAARRNVVYSGSPVGPGILSF